MKLFEELKRRNVFRVAAGYAIGAWLVLQVTDVLMGILELPAWIGRFAFYALLLGFPLALAFSWVFQLTPDGLKRDSGVIAPNVSTVGTERKLDLTIIVLLVISLGYFVVDKFVFTESIDSANLELSPRVEKSIAVLPFDTRGDEDEGGLFATGIHDDLLTQLAKIAELHVISRTSVLEYSGTTRNLVQIGNELGVNHILEGGVQKIGAQVRINAQLIDTRTDKHLWAETFDRELTIDNIFQVQSEIVQKISNSLHATLLPETEAEIARAPTNNMEAYRDYTAARHGGYGFDVRIDLLQSSVEKDPQFALAWAELAYEWQEIFWYDTERQDALDKALAALARAEAIDPEFPRLHMVRGVMQYHVHLDYEGALADLELAEHGSPGDSDIYMWRGAIYRHMGKLSESIVAFQRATQLDPRNYFAFYHLALTLSLGRYYEDAREVLKSGISKFPQQSSFIHWMIAMDDWYQFGDSRPLLRVLERPDWPATERADALFALAGWLADDLETANRHVLLLDPDDTTGVAFATPPFGMDTVHADIEIVRAAILMESGGKDEARAILEKLRIWLTQELATQSSPAWFGLQKLSLVLALLGAHEEAAQTAADMVRRFSEEPVRGVPESTLRAAHGSIQCHLGTLTRAEEEFRRVLSRENEFTLASLVNGWPPCRDRFRGTEHHQRLEEEFGHLSQGRSLD